MKQDGVQIRVRGQVQGVGFRPFVWRLAQARGLRGEVLNDPEGVLIRLCGAIGDLADALRAEAPPLARVDAVEVSRWVFDVVPEEFTIVASRGHGAETRVTPDAATCPDCLAEIRGQGRRRGYAFTNCTHCGPRFSILRGLPYDRAQTTMAPFDMCPACRAEYDNPADRRFHAQPIACPDCGPRLWLEVGGEERSPEDAGEILRAGGIVAVKGLGGFHLACDATDAGAVARLRARKRRPTKPFALMADLERIMLYSSATPAEEALLRDPSAPIVLLPRAGRALPEGVAPGQEMLGWMLPYTPLHHLLIDWAGGPLVMTSGNLSGEPQVIGNEEARVKLFAFADGFLMHDREIARRLDDSVMRADPPMVLRHARGRVPGTLALPDGFERAPQVLALGGQMKGAICLVKNGQALLSHHLGDLDDLLCLEEFHKAVADYRALFDHRAERIAVDAHPGYRATQAGQAMGGPVVEVFHHHAHLAACLAENGWPRAGGKVAGIVLDGTGLGPDGTVWGGELLLGGYVSAERVTHLRPVPLPGGDRASREPWRNLLAQLDVAGLSDLADLIMADKPRAVLRRAIAAGVNAPLSSSAGRLFDAFAAALGFDGAQSYEGEAGMWLESLAGRAGEAPAYPFAKTKEGLDPAPMWRAWAEDRGRGTPREVMARRFHAGLAQAFAAPARALVADGAAGAVALSGGCFQNALLHRMTVAALDGIPVLTHRAVPANDGGLALGQAVIAAAQRESD
ncbi:carbamoyltransferase HypF [Acidimangrovimonas sediminis]|uniref:carbamoyltransferase HypF n=1 Tax=Acidimangrovimonas sediminis TaxID=2056283 RepID=UPI000C80AFB4|nr:carbamoyltransferase HypF [Acidimangrovimonas sediminis]